MIRRRRLIELCRQLSNLLDAGVPITRALSTIVSGARGGRFRSAMSEVAATVGQGESLVTAFSRRADFFPPLFLRLIDVGERTGTADAVLRHMAEYFEGQDRLVKNTAANLIYPAVQFVVAILVIAGAKYVAGELVAQPQKGAPNPISALGATGALAAVVFLVKWFGSIGLVFAGYWFVVKVLRGKRWMDEIILAVPVIGRTVRTLAVARFSWAFQLCMKAGLGIKEGIACSMEAAGNAAFAARVPAVFLALENGLGLRKSLEAAGVFPQAMLEVVEVGETSGKIDQCLEKVAQQSFENAAFALKAMAQAFTWLVWALVAGLLVYYILSMYSGLYGPSGAINQMLNEQ